ncbi:hypothetical protein C8E99_2296 [Citricoccus muralis]|uniref:Uncharacterized protein n=2 Tax=Citricoccus muralis TaxID=169134 RepID=A0A3D9LDF8_9MICC|nr:hypothetical protein C8E99_2296 [Citricoccus muralis]
MLVWATSRDSIHAGILGLLTPLVSAALILLGTCLFAWSIPSPWFARISAALDRFSWNFTLTLSILSTACLFMLSAVAIAGSMTNQLGREDLLLSAVLATALAFGVFGLGGSTIRIGLSSHRARIRNAVWARWSASIALICLTAVLASFLPPGVDLIAITLPATLAILGSHYQRARSFDDEVRSFMATANNIRQAGFIAARTPEDPAAVAKLYDHIRDLQLTLVSRPRVSAPALTAHGFVALCSIADSRATGRDLGQLKLTGAERNKMALTVFGLSDSDFAMGTAQIFDGLLQQTAKGLAPSIAKTSPLLKDVLEATALPRPVPIDRSEPSAESKSPQRGFRRLFKTHSRGSQCQEPASMSRTIGLTFEP